MMRKIEIVIAVVALGVLMGASQPASAQQAAMESTSLKGKRVVRVREARNAANLRSQGAADWRSTVNASVAPEEYTVGEADVLHINVWKEPELSATVVVRPDGKISMPLVSEMKVAGMSASQIQQLLTDKLKSYLVAPQVTVTVTEIHSKTVYITGEVGRAGEYPLVGPVTVLQLIARAGGVTAFANRKGIFVLRNADGHAVRYPFDYSSVIHGKSTEQNIELRPGDTVVVP